MDKQKKWKDCNCSQHIKSKIVRRVDQFEKKNKNGIRWAEQIKKDWRIKIATKALKFPEGFDIPAIKVSFEF